MSERKNRTYLAIDLKSFYASAECVARGLDPLNTCLVVADPSRTNKTICLAVSPALKAFGVPGRPRLFEVEQIVQKINRERAFQAKGKHSDQKSVYLDRLEEDKSLAVDFITAVPRMLYYEECSAEVYKIYLKYIAPEDIHVYSIDEVFMDVTNYLGTYQISAHALAERIIRDVLKTTGITATAGIGTNLYLAKAAMDIVAKHMPADKDGVRIAELDEFTYRKQLWTHEPITDFWRVGRGYAKRLAKYDLYTMGDIAQFSLEQDAVLYKEFGVNAELLIDHAWGYEPTEIKDIKNYHADTKSIGSGQVLMRPYSYEEAKVIVKEMTDALALDLHEKGYVTDHISLYAGYDTSSDLTDYTGPMSKDYIGRTTVKPVSVSTKLPDYTSSASVLRKAMLALYQKHTDPSLLIRRINVTAGHVIPYAEAVNKTAFAQIDLFSDNTDIEKETEFYQAQKTKDRQLQDAMVKIQKRYGKNAVMTATSSEHVSTAKSRNEQIGGHRK